MILLPTQKFIHTETSGGIVLLGAAVVALFWVNSPWSESYHELWNTTIRVTAGGTMIAHTLREWVNDALMVIFFFVVGLEIKREFAHGELSDWRRASLPVLCALGGTVVPAGLYLLFNSGLPTARGWGIPMATDIAFALSVLALLGDRVPASARLLLLAIACVDDVAAILIIALFYSDGISIPALAAGAVLVMVLVLMRRTGVQSLLCYFACGVLFWLAILYSGVHATIAGVVLGLLTPTGAYFTKVSYVDSAQPVLHGVREAIDRDDSDRAEALLGEIEELTAGTEAPADRLVRMLHPWSSYFVLPIFALANAGVPLTIEMIRQAAGSPITEGIVTGLLLGKFTGILLAAFLAVRLGVADLMPGVGWRQMAGIGVLAGIGFTVSLFISDLAFADEQAAIAKVGVLGASALAGAIGYLMLRMTGNKQA